MKSYARLLFIEPRESATPQPLIDHVTRRICAAFRQSRPSDYGYEGVHSCYCGANSSACDYHLPGGELTNSLCIHYVAHHRLEVPARQLAKIESFTFGEAEPNEAELVGPARILAWIHAYMDRSVEPDRLRIWSDWGLDVTALCQALRGGCLPSPKIFTDAREDADELFALLRSVTPEMMPLIRDAARRQYGDVSAWGKAALRVRGWNREAWAIPMAEIIAFEDGASGYRRQIAADFRRLGPHAGAGIQTLLEAAASASADRLQDIVLAFRSISIASGLLIPPAAIVALAGLANGPEHDSELGRLAAQTLEAANPRL